MSGQTALTLGQGKAGKALIRGKVKPVPVAPARVKRLAGKRFRAVLPAVSVEPGRAPVGLGGGLRFRRGKRSLVLRDLAVTTGKAPVRITARAGRKRIRLFRVAGKLKVERAWRNLEWHLAAELKRARLDLTPAAARLFGRKLRVKRLTPGRVGVLNLEASRLEKAEPPPVDIGDPYFAQCGLPAYRQIDFPFPLAEPPPDIAGTAVSPEGPYFAWGFKSSFRTTYLKMFNGSIHTFDGAGRDGDGKWDGFTFPVEGGTWDAGSGQAVINTTGTGLFCNPIHHFRVALSDLTIVIAGPDSRLVAGVDFNAYGNWTTTRRIDIATLDPSGITPVVNGNEVTWAGIPAELTAAGAEPFCSKGGPAGTPVLCPYKAGDELDPVTVTIGTDG